MDDESSASGVGIVGVGAIGQIMAGHLVAARRDVIAWDTRPEARENVVRMGGRAAAALADIGTARTVLTIVFDDAGVESTAFGPEGLVETLTPGSTHIVLSTISPTLSPTARAAHRTRPALPRRIDVRSTRSSPAGADNVHVFRCLGGLRGGRAGSRGFGYRALDLGGTGARDAREDHRKQYDPRGS